MLGNVTYFCQQNKPPRVPSSVTTFLVLFTLVTGGRGDEAEAGAREGRIGAKDGGGEREAESKVGRNASERDGEEPQRGRGDQEEAGQGKGGAAGINDQGQREYEGQARRGQEAG